MSDMAVEQTDNPVMDNGACLLAGSLRLVASHPGSADAQHASLP